MFWRFNYLTSEIDTLLDKEDVTLQDVLNEEDVLQECKAQNKKLVDFIVLPGHFEQLVNMIVTEPSTEIEERLRYKNPNIACELITSDVNQITDTLAEDTSLLTKLADFLDTDEPLNPLQASFFSKVMGLLITRKSELTLNFLKSRENFIDRVLRHLDTSAIMDLLLRLITSMESQECKNACVAWLSKQQVIQKLIRLLNHSQSLETHSNAAQSLCDIIRISREQVTQFQDQSIPDTLLVTMESEEVITMLLDQMFGGDRTETVLTNGLSILQTLLESRKNGGDGQPDLPTSQELEKMSQGVLKSLNAITPRLKDLHLLLHEPPKQHYLPMATTLGTLSLPLGNTRLQTVRLIAFLLAANNQSVNDELARLGTLSSILNLFFEYAWNNFLHTQVEQCVTTILKNESTGNEHVLLSQLITECRILEKIVDAFEENQCQQSKVGGHRRGYMGHLTRISNSIVNNKVSIQNSQKIEELLQGLTEDLRKKWNTFVSGTLAELNKQNSTEFLGGSVSVPSSVDADDGFRDIAFPQEVAMQKLGFNGDDFCEQEDLSGTVFRDLSSRLSSLSPTSCENTSSSEPLFDEICAERNALKGDRDETNDEDLWEERELTFSPSFPPDSKGFVQENPFGMNETEEDAGSSKGSSDSEEDLDSPWQIHQVPEAAAAAPKPESGVEDMEITSDDWAKFDEAPMEVTPVAAQSPWTTSTAEAKGDQGPSSAEGGGSDWAKFDTANPKQGPDSASENWANFSPMNWTEQDDRGSGRSDVSQVSDIRSSAYAASSNAAVDSAGPPAVVTESQSSGAVSPIVARSVSSSSSPQPVLSTTIENGPA